MPPDLNSLPASNSRTPSMSGSPLSHRPRRISISTGDNARPSPPSPRSPSLSSLQAAAVINANLHRSPSRASPSIERRRSSLMNNIHLNDPSIPAPGELQQSNGSNGSNSGSPRLGRRSFALPTADPHHQRQPSLGELHQELENEQEAQVNRLLHLIRSQQDQLAALQRGSGEPSSSAVDTAPSAAVPAAPASSAIADQSSPRTSTPQAAIHHLHHPHSLSRQSSSRLSTTGSNSRGTSPALRPQSGSLGPLTEDFLLGGARDECAFYQAETQALTRENQMLKLRIRELERQVSDMGGLSLTGSATQPASTAMPSHHSPLASPPATFAGQSAPAMTAEAEATAKIE